MATRETSRGESFREDSRYRQCNREFAAVLGFFVVNLLLVCGVSMVLGYNVPAEEVQLIAGFPLWFFFGGVVGSLILIVLPVFLIRYFFEEMPLGTEEEWFADDTEEEEV